MDWLSEPFLARNLVLEGNLENDLLKRIERSKLRGLRYLSDLASTCHLHRGLIFIPRGNQLMTWQSMIRNFTANLGASRFLVTIWKIHHLVDWRSGRIVQRTLNNGNGVVPFFRIRMRVRSVGIYSLCNLLQSSFAIIFCRPAHYPSCTFILFFCNT